MNEETNREKMRYKSIDNILLVSRTTREVLEKLYLIFQVKHRSPSLENFARALKIPSKGYLSNLLSGKTKLGEKHVDGIAEYFTLSMQQKQLLLLMSKVDRKKKEIIEVNLQEEVNSKKKLINTVSLSKSKSPSVLIFLIYNLVYLNKYLTHSDIISAFPLFSEERIAAIIEEMARLNLILFSDENKIFIGGNKSFYFDATEYSDSEFKEYLSEQFHFISASTLQGYQSTGDCLFDSSIITVKEDVYREWIKEFKKKLDHELTKVQEDDQPDQIISINIQAFKVLS